MRTLILAGGLGSRISEETITKPKPMVTIGGQPILKHIMEIFFAQGVNEFTIAIGYKGHLIQNWVRNSSSPYLVDCLDTGLNTFTGGRIKHFFQTYPDKRIFMTYGDGLANVNLKELLNVHELNGRSATVTAVRPPARFGALEIKEGRVITFGEKIQTDAGWINGGFFVLDRNIIEFFDSEDEPFEKGPLVRLAQQGELGAYKHFGFWKPMDTLREREDLQILAQQNPPPWSVI